MQRHQVIRLSFLAVSTAFLVGCSSLQQSQSIDRSAELNASLKKYVAWQNEQSGAKELTKLTDLIKIPILSDLVEHGLKNSPSLQQTILALEIIKSKKQKTRGNQLPSADLSLSGNRVKDSDNQFDSDLSISWELDIWSKLSDQTKAAEQDILSSSATLQSARDSLAANIMRTWLQSSYQTQLIAVEQERLGILENNEALVQQRYRSGIGSLKDLDSARTDTYSTRATIVEYEETLSQTNRTLAQLIGEHSANYQLHIDQNFPDIVLPLATLPEQDLARRPDLKKQYANIQAAQLRANVAYKDLLPSFSLEAALSDSSDSLRDVLFADPVWSLLSQITLPLFQGGKLRAARDIAELEAEQAYWAYQETLLTAITETENTLGLEKALVRQVTHINDALKSAQSNSEHFKSKYKQGLVDILDLLQVQQQTFNLKAQWLQLTFDQLSNRIDLGLALGLGV